MTFLIYNPKNLIFIMRQVKASKTKKLDVSEQIFDATDRLMAKEGLHHLLCIS